MLRASTVCATLCLFVFGITQASLLYPENTLLQLTFGVSVPVAMSKRGGTVFSSGFQFNYALPWNESQIVPAVIAGRQIRDLNLQDAYYTVEGLLSENGGETECLLRAICEFAQTPFDAQDNNNLEEEIVRLFLTPSEDLPVAVNSNHHRSSSLDELYHRAERLGRRGVDCTAVYPDCTTSPLKLFTELAFAL